MWPSTIPLILHSIHSFFLSYFAMDTHIHSEMFPWPQEKLQLKTWVAVRLLGPQTFTRSVGSVQIAALRSRHKSVKDMVPSLLYAIVYSGTLVNNVISVTHVRIALHYFTLWIIWNEAAGVRLWHLTCLGKAMAWLIWKKSLGSIIAGWLDMTYYKASAFRHIIICLSLNYLKQSWFYLIMF